MKRTGIRLVFLCFLLFSSFRITAQIPATCFEIQSILVAACGQPEGENEMVRFITGPNILDIADMNIIWPPPGLNPFLGIVQNSQTAAKVAAINASITACGLVREPPAGQIPPGSKVLLATSTNMNVTANSFANLTDTLYIIFQVAGNTSGHFKNFGPVSTGSRTLHIDFGPGCVDEVTYQPYQLVTSAGVQGDQVGSYVNFTPGGNTSYGNDGCQALLQIPYLQAQSSASTACSGDTINLSATIQNINPTGYQWSGGTGTFLSPSSSSSLYITGPADNGTVTLYLTLFRSCGNPVSDSIEFTSSGGVLPFIQSSTLAPYCKGSDVTLFASGGTSYLWSSGETSSDITVSSTGNYIVTISNSCESQQDSIYINFSEVSAAFTATPLTGEAPLEVFFTDSSSSNVVSWNWDFGDGNTSTDELPLNIYTTAGIFPVTLKVTNLEGCTSYAFTEIIITGDTATFIPTAFSPNSDTKNEIFFPVGANISSTSGVIYNRWGQIVNSWENSEGWNGLNLNGQKAQEGIYIYDIHSTFVWGKSKRYRGWMMLIR